MKKFILKTIFPLLRGSLKALPYGNIIFELAENLIFKKKISGEGIKEQLKHNYASIATQFIVMTVVVVCYLLKIVTIEELIGYINVFKGE